MKEVKEGSPCSYLKPRSIRSPIQLRTLELRSKVASSHAPSARTSSRGLLPLRHKLESINSITFELDRAALASRCTSMSAYSFVQLQRDS